MAGSRLQWMMGAAVVGLCCAAAPARADWTAFGGSTERTFFTTEKITAPVGVMWKHSTSVYSERQGNRGGPVVGDGVVYFPSKNRIHAVDADTGELKWSAPEGDANDPNIAQITATPLLVGDALLVPDAKGALTAYGVEDGTMKWQFRTEGAIRSAPTLVDGKVYFGSDDDYVYCIDAETGDRIWRSNSQKRDQPLSDDAAASPAYSNGLIYINSADMKMYALEADTGRIVWVARVGAPSIDISPVAHGGRVYLAAGSTIYQFRLRGGGYRAFPLQQWVENDITTTPVITETHWFLGDRNGYFHCFTAAGRPVRVEDGKDWKVKLEGRPQGTPLLTNDTIFVSTDKGFVYGIDLEKGKTVWTYRTEAPRGMPNLRAFYPIRAPMAASYGKIFLVGDDGTLTCLSNEATDDEGPMITTPKPSRGAVMNGFPPLNISAYMWDEGSGINPDSVELLIDGRPVERSEEEYNNRIGSEQRKGWVYDPVKRLIRYATPKAEKGQREDPLINGRHTVAIQAADWAGNLSTMEWSFIVDNSLPRNAVAVKAKPGGNMGGPGGLGGPGGPGTPGGPGGYPGAMGSGMGPGGMGQGGTFRGGRLGGYTYGNRGRGGYNRGGFGPGGVGGSGFGSGGNSGGFGGSGGIGGRGRGGRGGIR